MALVFLVCRLVLEQGNMEKFISRAEGPCLWMPNIQPDLQLKYGREPRKVGQSCLRDFNHKAKTGAFLTYDGYLLELAEI